MANRNSALSRLLNGVSARLSPELASHIDYMRPSLRESWGGPLNGQAHRRDMVREIIHRTQPGQIIETGTYRGTSSEFFVHVGGVPLITIEANPRHHAYATRRLKVYPEVNAVMGDSRDWLRRLAAQAGHQDQVTFFYLDAHWGADLPLSEEVRIIAENWKRPIIMIDDFKVPGDSGYAYDDYGPGLVLEEENLPLEDMEGWLILYPALPSSQETGARRGSVVLVSPSEAPNMVGLETCSQRKRAASAQVE